MSREALTRIFPDGKTVFIPADGQPMPGYEQARAEIEARGGAIQTASKGSGFGFLRFLFGGARGGGADDEEESGPNSVVVSGFSGRSGRGGSPQVAFASAPSAAPDILTNARGNLLRGQTYAQAAPAPPRPGRLMRSGSRSPIAANCPRRLRKWPRRKTPTPVQIQTLFRCVDRLPRSSSRRCLHVGGLGLLDVTDVVPLTPLPPMRPVEFVVAAEESKPANLKPSSNGDLIAALLVARQTAPRDHSRRRDAPSNALALADPGAHLLEPPERPVAPGAGRRVGRRRCRPHDRSPELRRDPPRRT